MRISDWSSDVCSSDLSARTELPNPASVRVLPDYLQPSPAHVRARAQAISNLSYAIWPPGNFLTSCRKIAGTQVRTTRAVILPLAQIIAFACGQVVGKIVDDRLAGRDFEAGDVGVRNAREMLDERAEAVRSEEQTSELQSLMRSSYAVFC